MGVNLSGRSFLKLLDLTTEEIDTCSSSPRTSRT